MLSVVIESELIGDAIPNKRKIMLKLFPNFAAVNVQGEGFCLSWQLCWPTSACEAGTSLGSLWRLRSSVSYSSSKAGENSTIGLSESTWSSGMNPLWVWDALCHDYPERSIQPWQFCKGEWKLLIIIVGTVFWVCNCILCVFQTFPPSLAEFCVCLQWLGCRDEWSPHWLKIRWSSFVCHIDFADSSPLPIQGWEHIQTTFILALLSSSSLVSCSLVLLLVTGHLDVVSHWE